MKPVAIFYVTSDGHARRIAGHVAQRLGEQGVVAIVMDVAAGQLPDTLKPYSAAIIIGSVHVGRQSARLIEFVEAHRFELDSMPNAFVPVTLSQAGVERTNATPDEHARFLADVTKMTDQFIGETSWRPKRVQNVAGALLYTKYGFLVRFIMKRIAKKAGGSTDTSRDHDYTNWAALDEFVRSFAQDISAPAKEREPSFALEK